MTWKYILKVQIVHLFEINLKFRNLNLKLINHIFIVSSLQCIWLTMDKKTISTWSLNTTSKKARNIDCNGLPNYKNHNSSLLDFHLNSFHFLPPIRPSFPTRNWKSGLHYQIKIQPHRHQISLFWHPRAE